MDGIAPFLAISSLTKMQLNRIHVVTVFLYKHKKIQRRAKTLSFGSLARQYLTLSVSRDQIDNFALNNILPVTIIDTITA